MLGHEHSAPPGTRRHLCPPPSAAGRLPRNQAERPGAAHTIAAHRCHLELRGFSQLTRKGLRSPPRGRCVCAALSCRNRGVFCDGRTESDSPPLQKSLGTAWVTGTEGTACARALAWPAVCSNGVTTLAVGSRTPRGTVTHGRWPRYPGASGLTSHEPTETRQRGLLGGIFLTEEMIVFVFPTVVFTSIFRKGTTGLLSWSLRTELLLSTLPSPGLGRPAPPPRRAPAFGQAASLAGGICLPARGGMVNPQALSGLGPVPWTRRGGQPACRELTSGEGPPLTQGKRRLGFGLKLP